VAWQTDPRTSDSDSAAQGRLPALTHSRLSFHHTWRSMHLLHRTPAVTGTSRLYVSAHLGWMSLVRRPAMSHDQDHDRLSSIASEAEWLALLCQWSRDTEAETCRYDGRLLSARPYLAIPSMSATRCGSQAPNDICIHKTRATVSRSSQSLFRLCRALRLC
jgi:hypothetical protein